MRLLELSGHSPCMSRRAAWGCWHQFCLEKATGWNYSTPSEAEVYMKKTQNFTQQTTRASCAGCSGSILTASALAPTLLVGCRGIQERASFTEKGKFTEPEHSVASVEVSNIHEIVPGFGHEPDDFRD